MKIKELPKKKWSTVINNIIIYCDGFVNYKGIKGGCSVVVFKNNKKIFHKIFKFEKTLNNGTKSLLHKTKITSFTYEYFAIYVAVYIAVNNFKKDLIKIYMDNLAVVRQVNNEWKCSNKNIAIFKNNIISLLENLDIEILWVSRKKIVKILGH